MSDHVQGGNDIVIGAFGGRSLNTLVGDGTTMSGHVHGGNDTLIALQTGQTGSALLYGDAFGMADHAHGGNDNLTFTIGDEAQTGGGRLYGDGGGLSGDARGGNDTLTVVDLHGNLHLYSFLLIGDVDSMFGNAQGGKGLYKK
ncbi:hypothetical protein I6F14_33190 [Bradyrhizobium sp. IC3069]|uniref:hypothetical protein n=1 Tax=unclassified Bradyrhizobium TaxID=2631580 RepID=UPI001CD623E7|nr:MULTISPECIES: hypothetical protein [unclassified Bradyrhizobium]MCA1365126.1 hypothetical protein [Bradyrhizobium sp. IC4059]MCA1522790.1 hypothetical protein [Bradyrhizobium sp. IC3069]